MSQSTIALIVTVDHLFEKFDGYVKAARWTDAALAAAGMWQATDDTLGGASTPLAKAAAGARTRPGLVGYSVARVLDAALGLRARPARRVRAGEQGVDDWRETLIEVALQTAALAVEEGYADGGAGSASATSSLAGVLRAPPAGVRGALTRIPSSFRAFDQHPDDIAALVGRFAARWPDRSRPVVIVGVRTSGSYLAPFAVAHLRRAGFRDVTIVSARPEARYLPSDVRALRAAARRGGLALVVDDPPTTGGTVARVCADLVGFGFPSTAVVLALALFADAPSLPEALSPFESVVLPWTEWSIHRRLSPEQVARDLTPVFSPATVAVTAELDVPPELTRSHTKRLYRVEVTPPGGPAETRTILASGGGLGYFGRLDVAVAAALKDRVPAVLRFADGVLHTAWPTAARPTLPPPEQVADYVIARHDALRLEEDPSAHLRGRQPVWEVASGHLSRVYGRYWPIARVLFVDRLTRRLLRTADPSLPDGDMRPSAWLAGSDSNRVVKSSFADRAFSNFDLFSADDRFDIVGAAVHTGNPEYARTLRTSYERRSARRVSPERWLAYELVHLWDCERLGTADAAEVSRRKSQALRRYLAETLLAGLEGPAQGPVVALDVDGVLETEVLGFKAPTPASVLCLRALHAHGYRTVLVTGRCLDDVVELAGFFGLAGGAAEYGSVLYDRSSASVTPLVTPPSLDALAWLRERLQADPSVRVDRRYGYSVRASTVDMGRLRTFVAPPSVVPPGLRAVLGEEQTDFIGAQVDKLDGARALLAALGEQTPVLAVGDTAADVSMLVWAQRSVVPRHAEPTAKAVATWVAPHPYQTGLADAIGSLLGHRPGTCADCAAPEPSADTRSLLRLLRAPEGSRMQTLVRTVPLLLREIRAAG